MIRVNDEYVIDVDSMCYTTKIDKHKTDKKGNPVYEVVGYYKDLDGAILAVIKSMNRRKLSEGVYDLKTALGIIQASNEQFEKLLREVIKENS